MTDNYKFDTDKPSGFPKRVMDISLARKLIGYNPTTSLLDGLKNTWNWFINNEGEYLKRKNYFKEGDQVVSIDDDIEGLFKLVGDKLVEIKAKP